MIWDSLYEDNDKKKYTHNFTDTFHTQGFCWGNFKGFWVWQTRIRKIRGKENQKKKQLTV